MKIWDCSDRGDVYARYTSLDGKLVNKLLK